MQDFGFSIMVLTRIAAAVGFGFGIGLEREITNKYAGLRTHILVCLGSCVFTILSIYAFPMAIDHTHPQAFGDPARIAAQILTGIGFIGGGTVLRHGSSVFGLTTAATLWVAAAIGMACGVGMLSIGLIATIVSIGVLVLIRFFEKDVLVKSTKNMRRFKVTVFCTSEKADSIHNFIVENFESVHEISKKTDSRGDNLTKIVAVINIHGKNQAKYLYKKFGNIDGLESISINDSDE